MMGVSCALRYRVKTRALGVAAFLWVFALMNVGVGEAQQISGTQIAPVFSSVSSDKASYLRIFNVSETEGDVEVVFVDPSDGTELGIWTQSIASFASPQFTVSDMESDALPAITAEQAAGGYSIIVRGEFPGRLQHVVWNAAAGSLTNMSSCGGRSFKETHFVSNVHTSRIGGYPSTLYVSNEQSTARGELFRVYDAATGEYIGDWNNDSTEPAGVRAYAVSDIESALGLTAETTPLHLNFVLDTFGTGIMQNVVNNVDGGALTDMTQACYLDGSATITTPQVTSVPSQFGFDSHYQKYADAGGIPVITSEKVPDEALLRAREIVLFMLKRRPDLHFNMVVKSNYVGLMAEVEVARDLPELDVYQDSEFSTVNDLRGLAAGRFTAGAEENVLQYPTDVYQAGTDILLHEFAHGIMGQNFLPGPNEFTDALDSAFEAAQASGVYAGIQSDGATAYAMTNRDEYWAEGAMSYFGAKGCIPIPTNPLGHSPCTREELRVNDAPLYDLLRTVFTDDEYPALN